MTDRFGYLLAFALILFMLFQVVRYILLLVNF